VRVSLTPRSVPTSAPIAITAFRSYSASMVSCELLEPGSELHRLPRRSRADTAPVVLSILVGDSFSRPSMARTRLTLRLGTH
jgi:hypothetical protein